MFYTLRKTFNQRWFDLQAAGIFKAPAIQCNASGSLVVVSQLYHPDVTMYLLATKSFARYIAPKEFVIVDDGLTSKDRALLSEHLGRVRFVLSADVDTGPCPRGGCWERLMTLSSENESHYSVQLDSDTLTLADPVLVRDCARNGRTFTMGTTSGQATVSFEAAANFAMQMPSSDHIQYQAERALLGIPGAAGLKYVRGCAGFTGFARGELRRERIVSFSEEMERILGRKTWARWGSEQVTSNLLAANAPNAIVLPVSSYPFLAPGIPVDRAHLVHFFGTYRFLGGVYSELAQTVIRELNGLKHMNA